MTKRTMFVCAGFFAALLLCAALPSCSDPDDAEQLDSAWSATYYIAGKVCNSDGKPVEGIEVTLTEHTGAALSEKGSKDKTDAAGEFAVAVLSNAMNGGTFTLELKDPKKVYETMTVDIPIEGTNDMFIGGDGGYYMGEYKHTEKKALTIWKPGEKPEEQEKKPAEEPEPEPAEE